jgi:Ca2+-binding RTX toxin-like protein
MFKLTPTQIAELQTLRNSFPTNPTLGNNLDYALLYDKVLTYIYSYIDAQGGWQNITDNELDRASVLWLEGARDVNRDTGDQSDFIRDYNNLQSQLRYGTAVTDAQMNQASDTIVIRVINQILDNASDPLISDIPNIETIASSDAQPTAQLLFNNEEHPAGWAGNPLFLFLGYSDSYNQNILHSYAGGNTSDTYDLLSVLKISQDILGSFSSILTADTFTLLFGGLSTANQVNATNIVQNAYSATDDYLTNAYGVGLTELLVSSTVYGVIDDIYLGTSGNDILEVGDAADDDLIHAGDGDDIIKATNGDDFIDGGTGNDTMDYSTFNAGLSNDIIVDLASGEVTIIDTPNNDKQRLYNIENVNTGDGDDVIHGSNVRNVINSGNNSVDGIDEVHGLGGDDLIDGGAGNDNLYGDEGNDVLLGDTGNDNLYGGANNDELLGGAGKDVLNGNSGNDILTGGADADKFVIARQLGGATTIIKDFSTSTVGEKIDLSAFLSKISSNYIDTNSLVI